ncbi:hypothetical protein MKX08_003304 [Trichoderma sp. CBMAI-0020]|nr:hypothetical protein MKX08_003304 [Trichoderma sp. CBMAI-0020]
MSSSDSYTIGWICALPIELAAAAAMLDESHGTFDGQRVNDRNNYVLGRIGQHNVAMACLPAGVYGTTSATVVATEMLTAFPSIKFGLMVGIGGGVPSTQHDIRLGDVVVGKPQGNSAGVIQYDLGKVTPKGLHLSGSLNKPPSVLLTALSSLEALHMREGSQTTKILAAVVAKYPKLQTIFSNPGPQNDCLYAADYIHGDGMTCDNCDRTRLVSRPQRDSSSPVAFYGTIASGNRVMKDGTTRDRLGKELNAICFEMEAAGLMDNFPCLVIRGICDYSDSHKNKSWQGYAAATAAAYAKELLAVLPTFDIAKTDFCPVVNTQPDNTSGIKIQPDITSGINTQPDNTSAYQDSSELHRTFLVTRDWYMRDELRLGSLIPDIRYPNQDAHMAAIKEPDVSIRVDQGFEEYFADKSMPDSWMKKIVAKVFSISDASASRAHWHVEAEESRCISSLDIAPL